MKKLFLIMSDGGPRLASEITRGNTTIHLANAKDNLPLIGFVNELKIGSDGWAMLAPLGDYPNMAVVVEPNGTIKKFPAIQRLDKQAVTEMANTFRSSPGKFLTGLPIYKGHPDMPGMSGRYADKALKGVISEVEARNDGLWGRPIFTEEGRKLVEQEGCTYFSPRWTADETGHMEGTKPILRPNVLVSAGLTPNPNLPVKHLANAEWQQQDALACGPQQETQTTNHTMKKNIIDLLVALGVQMANDATDEQIEVGAKSALDKAKKTTTLANEKDKADSDLVTERNAHAQTKSDLQARATELSTLRTELANERKAHIESVLDIAVKDGRITVAQRPEWSGKLAANFANESEALKKVTPALKTDAKTAGSGDRKLELANESDWQEHVLGLVRVEMANSKCSYEEAFATVQRKETALFQQHKGPEIKYRRD